MISKAKWAKHLEVSTSGYYDWINNRQLRQSKQAELTGKVNKIFNQGKGTYGTDRICGLLRKQGYKASYDRIKRIMEENGLKSIHSRKRQRSLTDSSKARDDSYKNIISGVKISEPFQVITSDISYIRTKEGFDYLCKIRDVKTGIILSFHQDERMTKELVIKAIRAAKRRWSLPEGTIIHSDRGSQYTAAATMELIKKYGWEQSFSRVGKPGDNAWSESFFSILKKETVHWKQYITREEARQTIFEYIEVFYNRERVQKRLGYLSPMDYLNSYSMDQFKCVA